MDIETVGKAEGRISTQFTETILNPDYASENVGASVIAGHSVLLLQDVVSPEECATLLSAGRRIPRVATTVHADNLTPNLGRTRQPIKESFTEAEQDLCDRLLTRTLDLVSAEETPLGSNISQACFGAGPLETVINNPLLSFAAGEPAVNIYTKGGSFEPHQDGYSLTILAALSEPQAFEGGGTAFFKFMPKRDPRISERNNKPAFVLTPPRGSVIIFGGTVLHAGCPVLSGERGVFVASLSLAAAGAAATKVETCQ